MGMAASQARWISLAARKTNVEYEGQQINQARTALANQSSELWNQLYQMKVPTPPSSADFTKTQYSFESDGSTKTITNIQSVDYTDDDGVSYNAYVTYNYQAYEYAGIKKYNYNPQVHQITTNVTTSTSETPDEESKVVYMVGTKILTSLIEAKEDPATWATYVAALDQIAKDEPDSEVAKDWQAYKDDESSPTIYNLFFWRDNAGHVDFTDKNGLNGLDACMADPTRTLFSYYADDEKKTKEVKSYAYIEYEENGRASNMQLQGSTAVYSLDAQSVTDEAAYNDAMNQYYYNKQVYEKNVQDINAKTEQIQTEDRTLELRLKALDTEQNALQTEMDAVHKIISKNIENTFKTFES